MDLINSKSVLVLEDLDVDAGGLRIKWQSATNRMYRVLGASNLLDGFIQLETEVILTPPTNCILLAPGPWKFFRLELDP